MKNPWVKLWRNTLNDEKVAFLMRRYGHECLTFWVGLLTKADDGVLLMDEDMFADLCLLEEKRYRELRDVFVKRGLVAIDEAGRMVVVNWDEYQTGESSERVRRFREAQRAKAQATGSFNPETPCNGSETPCNDDETEMERSEGEGYVDGYVEEEGEGERASAAPPPSGIAGTEKATPAAIVADWYEALARFSHVPATPPPKAESWAAALVAYSGGDMAKARAIRTEYFEHWRELWFATCKADKAKPIEARAPDFDFRAYCANAQSIAARIAARPAPAVPRSPTPTEPPPTEEERAQVQAALGEIARKLSGERIPA